MKYEPTDKSGMFKDQSTGAIVNRDLQALNAYKLKKKQNREFIEMQKRQESLESEVSEIKDMLKTILGKLDNDK
jgi:arginine repressor